MSTTQTAFVVEPATQDIVMTRVFDAPRELVFSACTDPAMVARWWGPRRLTTTVERMDAGAGDSAGNEFAFRGVYHDVVAPQRVVNTFEFEGVPGHVALESATFDDLGWQTRLTTRTVFQTVEDRDGMVQSGMEDGATESMDRLAELIETFAHANPRSPKHLISTVAGEGAPATRSTRRTRSSRR